MSCPVPSRHEKNEGPFRKMRPLKCSTQGRRLLGVLILMTALLAEGRLRNPRQTIFPGEDESNDESCTTPSRRAGTCVRFSQCTPLRATTSIPLIRQSHCGFQGIEPKVCCPGAGTIVAPPVKPLGPSRRPPIVHPGSSSSTKTPSSPISNRKPSSLPEDCGLTTVIHSRIVNGKPASLKAWPWMTVMWVGTGLRESICGGTLISNKHVLTAAHCVIDRGVDIPARDIRVRLGEHNIHSDDDGATPEEFGVVRVVRHENFNPRVFHNDIALVELNRTVQFSDAIFPACLPYGRVQNERLTERRGFLSGWGSVAFGGPASSVLREAQIPIWKQEDCIKPFSNISVPIIPEQLCAGTEDGSIDACEGDSGGPLVIPVAGEKIRYYLVGITSFGRQCAVEGFAGVYTRVTSYLDWISRHL